MLLTPYKVWLANPHFMRSYTIKLKDRITPHVTNFFRLRLIIEKQEGKEEAWKWWSGDGGWVCVYVCMFMCSEWVRVWVNDVSVVCVSEGCESEWSEWSEWSEVKWSGAGWSGVKWSEVKWSEVSEWMRKWVNKGVNDCQTYHAKEAESEGRQGVHPTPWQCILSHAWHTKEPEPEGRQGVHLTPWQCSFSHTCHTKKV